MIRSCKSIYLLPPGCRLSTPLIIAHHAYAGSVNAALDIRTNLNLESESLSKKIREAKVAKIPYTLVIGDQEVADKTVTLESREKGKVGTFTLSELTKMLSEEITKKE